MRNSRILTSSDFSRREAIDSTLPPYHPTTLPHNFISRDMSSSLSSTLRLEMAFCLDQPYVPIFPRIIPYFFELFSLSIPVLSLISALKEH